jgi:PAS domain S-box-containing protein
VRIVTFGFTRTDGTERALLDSETGMQQVLDNTSAVVFAKDSFGRYLFVNREFERLSGRPAREVIGRTDGELFAPELASQFHRNDLRVLQEKRPIEFEEIGDFGEGTRTFLASKFPLLDSDGSVFAVCGVVTDITERKLLEEAVSQAALAVSESEGETLYRVLARYLATILRVDGAFIATFEPEDPAQMRMIALHLDGQTRENFSYPRSGTACETVVAHGFRIYPSRLCEMFPVDRDYKHLGIEGYAGFPLVDSTGRPVGLVSVISRRPLTRPAFIESVLRIFAVRVNAELERVAADTARRASEASYREIFEASDDFIFIHDWDTDAIVDANPRACHALGYTREELLRVRIADLSSGEPPYTWEEGRRWLERAKRDGSARCEWRRRNRDGSLHWDEVRLKTAVIEGRRRVLVFAREVTEARLREQELRQSEDRLRATVTAALDSIVVMDHQGRIIEFNPAAEKCFGYERADVIGRRLSEIMIPERYREAHERGLRRYLSGRRGSFVGRRIEIHAMRADGTEFPVEVAIGVAKGADGPIFIGYLQDISELKSAEERRIRLEGQLRQAQKMEAIGQLTGGIAHDFNNLLTSIVGYVVLAAERDTVVRDPRLADYLAQARRSCERARDLIQQMLMFSRSQPGSPRTFMLGRLVEELLDTLRHALPATVELAADVSTDTPAVRADPLQVEQVLLNLCINARDAVEGRGTVRVVVRSLLADGLLCAGCHAQATGEYVEMCVEDDGRGIPPEVLERIFEPFFSTKETGKGSGMGLAMAHGIVHEHRGHVVVETTVGRGSRFRVLWPALAGDQEHECARSTSDVSGPRRRQPRLRGSVLVVDDEATVGEFMRELLQTWGINATFAPGPQAALELLAGTKENFDLVITDETMPRMTGLELARTLRAIRPGLPVVLYTGYRDGLTDAELQSAGVHAVLRKPIEPGAVELTLSRLLGQARRAPPGPAPVN